MTAGTPDLIALLAEAASLLGAALEDANPDADDWRMAAGSWLELYHGMAGLEIPQPETEPELPPGFYGRIEIPGYRENRGWIAEETRFGKPLAVVRNRDGSVQAMIPLGDNCRVLPMPLPLQRPGESERLAITSGNDDEDVEDDDPYMRDDDERPV